MKQYFISGIWTSVVNGQPVVTYVMLHDSSDKKFKTGRKVHQDRVIKLMKTEDVLVHTIEWSYTFKEWQKGTAVSFEKINDIEQLVTKKDGTVTNCFSSLLPMKVLTAKSKTPEAAAL